MFQNAQHFHIATVRHKQKKRDGIINLLQENKEIESQPHKWHI